MFKTVRSIVKLGKSMAVGLTIGQLQRTIATRFRESKEDPLYAHWYLALDSLIVASRQDFDEATKALLEELEAPRKNPVRASSKIFTPTPN